MKKSLNINGWIFESNMNSLSKWMFIEFLFNLGKT